MSQPNLLELEAPIKICGEQAGRRARATLQALTLSVRALGCFK